MHFGNRVILDHVNLDVREGEIVTIIGPNGAGKSTLVRVLLGLQAVSSGEIVRKPGLRVGYVPQRFPLTPNVPLDVQPPPGPHASRIRSRDRCGTWPRPASFI